jgi:hypothetical protein
MTTCQTRGVTRPCLIPFQEQLPAAKHRAVSQRQNGPEMMGHVNIIGTAGTLRCNSCQEQAWFLNEEPK